MATTQPGKPSNQTKENPPYSADIPGRPVIAGETIPRGHQKTYKHGLLKRPIDAGDDIKTVFNLLQRSAALYSNEPAIGSRTLVKMHTETKKDSNGAEKTMSYPELTSFKYMVYSEFHELVLNLASGLRKLGLQTGDMLHIFASTRSVSIKCWALVQSQLWSNLIVMYAIAQIGLQCHMRLLPSHLHWSLHTTRLGSLVLSIP